MSKAARTTAALALALLSAVEGRQPVAAQQPRRLFPDATARIAVLTDQLPGGLTPAQVRFAATHFVGTQKLSLDLSRPLRAVNPGFLVLHYRLGLWQSAPHVQYIVDGQHWSNDYPQVTQHESWFWHNPDGKRVASNQDGKLLMNIADPGFRAYWKESIAKQVEAGDYDGVFLDSASPALLQWEARTPLDRRLLGTGVRFNRLPELGNRTWIDVWHEWIADLDAALGRRGIPLIPNVGAFATSWDNTDYSLTAGVFCEGFLDPTFDEQDWRSAANQTLSLVARDRIVILQNYLGKADNVAKREYLLANYLLVKGRRTYLSYFATSTLDWYPEWNLDLGRPKASATRVDDLAWQGVYRREYDRGMVLVNPSMRPVSLTVGDGFSRVVLSGGGAIGENGVAGGTLTFTPTTHIQLAPRTAAVLVH
ncbi:MAG: hypothetical protein JSU08_16140 [Acidobacteria bacterium]|nr:hypothetical protein [Acidobacteriota bacterium]